MAIQYLPTIDTIDPDDEMPLYSVVVGNDARISVTQLAEAVADINGATVATFSAQGARLFFAGPDSGTGEPSFRAITAADLPAQPYDVGGGCTGAPSAGLVLMRYPFPRAATFPAGFTSSQGVAGIAATGQSDFDLKKNGTSFGTMRFAAAAMIPTFIVASAVSFAIGDVLTVLAPLTPDATLAHIGFAFAGMRT